jgi:hypothetical protein
MDLQTYEDFLNIMDELEACHPDFEYERYQELSEELQLLDGFPSNYSVEDDIVVPVLKQPGLTVVLNVPEN